MIGRTQRGKRDETLSIVCAFDDRYLPLAGVALFSLATHMRSPQQATLHLLQDAVSERGRSALNEMLGEFGVFAEWHDVSAGALATQPRLAPFMGRTAHFHRLLMPYILPEIQNKAIYLDADLLILTDIHELWRVELNGMAIGACQDYLGTTGVAVANSATLGLDARAKYFNSGVMLVDLDAWRTHSVSERVLDCTDQNAAYLDAQGRFHQYDQYGLNVVLHGRWYELDESWNYGSEKAFFDASVIHFNGHGKPWSPTCTPQFRDIFYDYLKRSGWSREYQERLVVTRFLQQHR